MLKFNVCTQVNIEPHISSVLVCILRLLFSLFSVSRRSFPKFEFFHFVSCGLLRQSGDRARLDPELISSKLLNHSSGSRTFPEVDCRVSKPMSFANFSSDSLWVPKL